MAHIKAATKVRISPNGLIRRIKLPLNTTKATPPNAIKEPIINFGFNLSPLYKKKERKAANIGAVHIISDTLDASVMPRAVFSAMK